MFWFTVILYFAYYIPGSGSIHWSVTDKMFVSASSLKLKFLKFCHTPGILKF